MAEWSAEVEVDAGLVRRLLGAHFPDLDLTGLRLVGEGWDNAVWLVEERWAFRFPRRAMAIPGVEREIAVLPRLAPRLPLPVPVPAFVGRPAARYPWPYFGARYLPGRELADAALDDDARRRLARPLAAFLRALHDGEAGGLPEDPMGRADMARRVPGARERVAEVERLGLWRAPRALARVLDDAERLGPAAATVVAHGDLHHRHLLVDGDGALTGVIDWGDVCRADPAIDLPALWGTLPPEGRDAFLAAYGPVEEAALLRARVLAVFLAAALTLYAHAEGRPALARESLTSLERACA